MPSAAAPGATLVTHSSGVSHSPQPPVVSLSEARAQVIENTKYTGP